MAAIRKHLKQDGRFALEFFVPKMELLVNKPGARAPFAEYDDPDGRGKITVTESYVYEPHTQIKRVKTCFAIPGEEQEIEGILNMRMYFPQELDALIKYNGCMLEHKYKDYDRSGFDEGAEKQLLVCRLRE
jgi:hypothetical protein